MFNIPLRARLSVGLFGKLLQITSHVTFTRARYLENGARFFSFVNSYPACELPILLRMARNGDENG